jgi:hypothetical protein
MLVRFCGVILIVLGALFWIGTARSLVPIHMLLGIVLVIALWVEALVGARQGASGTTVALAVVWGLVVVILGLVQTQLLPGPVHWIVQVLHLLVGLVAIGLAETLGRQIKRSKKGISP